MQKKIEQFVFMPLVAALGLTGCESLGTDPTRKYELPANLAIDQGEREARPRQSEPLAAQPSRPPEYYPATGSLVGQGAAGEAPSRKEGKYTLNFDDADLAEVAKVILDETLKINYTLSPKVIGKVTLQTTRPLAEDELIPTLEMLLRMNGAVLIKNQGMYRIEPDATALVDAPGAKLGQAGMGPGYQLRVVPLRYVGVQEMQKVLEPLMPPKSVVKADETRNLLLLAGTAEELQSAIETVRLFDVDFMRGKSVAIFPLKNVEPLTIAQELDRIFGDTAKGPLAGVIRLLPIERLNAVMAVTTQPRYLDEVETWIERLDRYTTQRAGGIHVYRVQNVDALELANTLSNIFGGGAGAGGRRPSLSPGLQGGSIGTPYGGGGGFGTTGDLGGGGFGGAGGGLTGAGGDLDTGSSFGSSSTGGTGLGSTSSGFGTSGGAGTSGFGTGSGLSGTGTGGTGATGRGGFGGTGGGFGGGIGRGGSGRTRGSLAADLGNVRIVADPANNALVITARAQDYNEIEAVIKELDVVPLQVLIDASIVEVSLTGKLQYGLQWLFGHVNDRGAAALGSTGTLANDAVTSAATAAAASGGFTYAFVNSAKDIRIVLNALAQDNKINVISSPSLMVLNNQEAQINVGDKVPVPTYTAANVNTGTTTPFVTSSLQLQESGVTLRVRPRVNAGGLVTMELIQEVSTPQPVTVANTEAFQFAQRKIQSMVAVNSGDTLALGGLINDRSTRNLSGIPFLRDLPLLGPLFGTTNNETNRTELVVLITPRVVENRAKARDITNEFRRKLTGLYEPVPERAEVRNPPSRSP